MKEYAVVVIYTTEGYLVLLNRAIAPLGFCLPGGGVNILEESITNGAAREVEEEIGIKIPSEQLTFLRKELAADGRVIHIFRSEAKINAGAIKLSREHTSYLLTDTLDGISLAGNTKNFLTEEKLYPRLHLETIIDFGKYSNKNFTLKHILEYDSGWVSFLVSKGFKVGNDVRVALAVKIKEAERYTSSEDSSLYTPLIDEASARRDFYYSGGGDEDDGEYPDDAYSVARDLLGT